MKQVEGPDADDDDSIAAGVGFGPNFYKLVGILQYNEELVAYQVVT